MSIQWDEVTHLNGGLLLLRGRFQEYFEFNAFYPPMFDTITAGFFKIAGVSVFTGRLVSVTFSLLSLWAVFEFAYRTYGAKTALLSSVLLGIMPGFVWLSRVAMIETMLVFFFTVSMLFFFSWLRTHQNKFLVLSGLALGLGFLTKYQMIIAGVIMITSLIILGRGYLKKNFSRFPILIITIVAIIIPWIFVSYQIYASGMLNQWIYALEIGNPEKLLYSTGLDRFPNWFGQLPTWLQLPMFYSIEMTSPYYNVHPISFFIYVLSLLGLGLFAWRRKTEDKYLLIWFFVVYIFFTLIANKQWRYVLPIFPVLAMSAASLISSVYGKAQKIWSAKQISLNKKRVTQFFAGLFIVSTAFAVFYSCSDAYSWVAKDQIRLPLEEATNYVANRLNENESVLVVCAFNFFSQDMVRFYLYTNESIHNQVWQYPELPVDTYTPNFNVSEVITLCKEHNVKYVMIDEYGITFHYFNTTLTFQDVYEMLCYSGRFTLETKDGFGIGHAKILIMSFS
jgi:4-amino-4-deoxy-L-arabinose transferase-like glycosyltransferase